MRNVILLIRSGASQEANGNGGTYPEGGRECFSSEGQQPKGSGDQ